VRNIASLSLIHSLNPTLFFRSVFRELSKNNKGKKLTTNGGGSASAKKGLGVAGGSSASASTAKSKSKEMPIGEGSDNGVSGIYPPAHVHPGLYTSTPLDLPTAHSPMDIDYDPEESVSVMGAAPRPPIPAEYPSHPRGVGDGDREVSSDEDLEW